MHLSDAHHSRKMLAGACMVVAPIVLLVATVIHPASDMDEAAQVATIADNLDAWYVAHLLALIAIVVMVPAVLGLMHMLREREVAFGHVGGGLAMLGLFAFTGIVAIELVMWQLAAGGNIREAVALLERLNETAGIVIPFVIVSFGFSLGVACLAIGLYRARAVQSWMAVSVAAGAILFGVAIGSAMNWLAIVAAAFLVVGLGAIGRMVLRETDEAWEHTPEYDGFRPVPGMR
jgi:MFS family permease